mgnify:CR=1 FL=1
MKFLLCVLGIILVGCSEKKAVTEEVEVVEPAVEKKVNIESQLFEMGVTRFFDRNLPDFRLKAAVVNDFHSVLFFYNETSEKVVIFTEPGYLAKRETLVLKVNGEPIKRSRQAQCLVEKNGKAVLVEVDYTDMTEIEFKDFRPPGIELGHGFRMKMSETMEFSLTFSNGQIEQDVEIKYDPNKGWSSKASDIRYNEEPKTASVFTFVDTPMIEQFRTASKGKKECYVRSKIERRGYPAIKFKFDALIDDFNIYPIEFEILEGEKVKIDGVVFEQAIYRYELKRRIDEIRRDAGKRPQVRILISKNSNDEAIRKLLKCICERYPRPEYTISITDM